LKVIFIGGRDIHKLGGIENYMYNLATHLVRMGNEPVVYCESDRNDVEYINGFKVIHQKSIKNVYLNKIVLGLKATIRSIIDDRDAKVFHYNGWAPSLISFWIPRLFGKVSLLQGHGLEWKRTKYSPKQQKIMKVMERITAFLHNHLIMVSQEQTVFFLNNYNKKCTTIPSAVNLPSVNEINNSILEKYDLKKEGYFLYLGRLVKDKNPDILIEAYILSGISDKKLVIAGNNDSDPDYVNHLHQLSVGHVDKIVFTGAVYGEEKDKLLKECFAFCIPSTLEGMPITLLEAMAFSKVCITSDISACREPLKDSGVWVKVEDVNDLANQLIYLRDNYSNLKWQEKYNFQRIEKMFTWDKIAAMYFNYLEGIISHKP
jgi:glycosyltransferase involved in cell wall biosynthesis